MSFYADLYTYLQTQSGLTNLVESRMYPLRLPQDSEMPALVIQKISRSREYSQSGDSNLANPRYQFGCWAQTHEGAVALQVVLEASLTAFKGTMGAETVYSAFIDNVIDDHEETTDLYRQIVDVLFQHKD